MDDSPDIRAIARFVDLPDRGVRLCVARGGDGPNERTGRPVVIANGTGSDLRNRPSPLEWPIARSFEILAFDHRGLGRSEQFDANEQPTMQDFALDLLALTESEGIDEFDLIGVSFGGMVAQEVAIHGRDRVASLVLCCTSSGGDGGSSYPLHELYGEGRGLDERLDLWDTRAAHDERLAAQLAKIFAQRDRAAITPIGLQRQVEARRHHDTWERLGLIEADTLVACGEYDGVAPIENGRRLAAAIDGAEFASFEGGHGFLYQDRSAWPHIIDFLVN
ncbi:MAG: alpha/beta fold hydrolase [Actinomycetota bacterium]